MDPRSISECRHGGARLAAVVLNFRTPDQTERAVGSLMSSNREPEDLIVVNNDSPTSKVQALASRLQAHARDQRVNFRWVDTGRNLGFSGGMNVGIRAALDAGADRVLLVNSDVTVPPECVAQLER